MIHTLPHWSIASAERQAALQRDSQMIRTRQTCTLLFWLFLSMLALSSCRRTPDEEQVRQAIGSLAHAAETGDTSGVIRPLSDDFDGNTGDLDKSALANMMRLVALRGDHIGVTSGPITIEHRGERMIATLTVTLTSGGHVLPYQMGVYTIKSAWRMDEGQWRCYSASWKQPMP